MYDSFKCGVIRVRFSDRKRPCLHDGWPLEKVSFFSWISGRFGLVLWSEVSSFKRLDFNDLNVFQN